MALKDADFANSETRPPLVQVVQPETTRGVDFDTEKIFVMDEASHAS